MTTEATVAVVAWSALPYPAWSVGGLIEALAPEEEQERFDRVRGAEPAAIPKATPMPSTGLPELFAEVLGSPLARRAASVLLVPFPIDVYESEEPGSGNWYFDHGVGESGAVHREFANGADHLVVDLAHWMRAWGDAKPSALQRSLDSALAPLIPTARALGLPLLVTFPAPEPLPPSDPLLADLDAALEAWGAGALDEPEPEAEVVAPLTVLVVHPVHDAHRVALDGALLETALDYELFPAEVQAARSELYGGTIVIHLRSDRHATATELLRSVDAMLDPPLEGSFAGTLSGHLIDAAPDAPGCTVWTLTDDGDRLWACESFMYTSEETSSAACLEALGELFRGALRPGWLRELSRSPFVPLRTPER